METLALPILGGNPEQHNMRTTSCSLICVADGLAFQHAQRKKKTNANNDPDEQPQREAQRGNGKFQVLFLCSRTAII